MQRAQLMTLALVITLAGAIWIGIRSAGGTAPPATTTTQTPDPEPGPDALAATERTPAGREAPAAPPTRPQATAATPQPTQPPATGRSAPSLTLMVRSAATRAAIPKFRLSFRHAADTARAAGAEGRAELVLPPGAHGELLVEADGHLPFRAPIEAPPTGAPARHLDVFLDPAATASGIQLHVTYLDRTPVTDVRVQAIELPAGGVDDWTRGHRVWSRRTANPNGDYQLPDLAPGRYGIRVVATDRDGATLPQQPFERVFHLTGSNGYREDVVLEPGCLLTLDLIDRHGATFVPGNAAVGIDLRLPGGPAIARRWHRLVQGRLEAAIDAPPGPGPCWLETALAPNRYSLTIHVDGRVAAQQTLQLNAGDRQTERIVVH